MAAMFGYNKFNNYFADKNDPGLSQTLDLSGNVLSITNGNSVNLDNATTISTSRIKLTAQAFISGLNITNFTSEVRSEGQVISVNPLGAGSVAIDGLQARVNVSANVGNPSIQFEKSSAPSASIVYDGAHIEMSSLHVSTFHANKAVLSTLRLNNELLDSLNNPGSAGQVLQSSGAGLPVVWGSGVAGAITSVQSGSNIFVDSTNPISPIVNLSTSIVIPGDISCSNLNLNGGYINFYSTATLKAAFNYDNNNESVNLVNNTVGGAINIDSGFIGNTVNITATGGGGKVVINGTDVDVKTTAPGGKVNVSSDFSDVNITVGGNVNITNGTTLNTTFYNGGMDMNAGSIDNACYVSINGNMNTTGAARIILNEQSTLNTVYMDNNGSNFSIVRGGAATLTEVAFVDFPVVNLQAGTPKLQLSASSGTPADMRYDGTNLLLTANNAQTSLVVNGTNTEIRGDSGLSQPATLAFTDPSIGLQNTFTLIGGNSLQLSSEGLQIFGGANAIMTLATNSLIGETSVLSDSGKLYLRASAGNSVILNVVGALPGLEVTDTATRILGDSSSAYNAVLQFYDNNGGANFNLIGDTNIYSLKMENAPASADFITKQLSGTPGGSSGIDIKSENGYVRFLDSTGTNKASVDYNQLNDKVTMTGGEVALLAGTPGLSLSTGGDLVLTGAAIQSPTSSGTSGEHLRIKLNGVYYKIKLEND